MWLVHRGGFCGARVIKSEESSGEPSPRILIELLHNGEQMMVEEDDTEKANPRQLDLVEDISQLNHLNEASILHCLRQRYANNLVHTHAGPILMVVNPMAPLSLYSEKVSTYTLTTQMTLERESVFMYSSLLHHASRSCPCSEDVNPKTCHRISTPHPKMRTEL